MLVSNSALFSNLNLKMTTCFTTADTLKAQSSSSSKTSWYGVFGFLPQPSSPKQLAGQSVTLNTTQLYLVVCWLEECPALVLPDCSLHSLSDSLSVCQWHSDKNGPWSHLQLGVITNSLKDIRAQEGKELLDTWRHQVECYSLATHAL